MPLLPFWMGGAGTAIVVVPVSVTAYTRTREQLRDLVLRKVRVLGVDRTASSEEEAIVDEAIDLRLKELHRLGTLWWKVAAASTSVALTGNVATAVAPADMWAPITVKINLNNEDYPVSIVDTRYYQNIGTKLDTGRPEVVVVSAGLLRFYPVPDQAYTAKIVYEKIVSDTAPGTPPDVDVSLIRWVKDLVAYDVGDDFRVPEPRMMRFAAESQKAERNIRALIAPRIDNQPVPFESF